MIDEHIRVPSNGSQRFADINAPALDALLRNYGLAGSAVEHISSSENGIFRLRPTAGPARILRVHRVGYRTRETIKSELLWIEALRREAGLSTPVPIESQQGSVVSNVETSLGSAPCVLFEELPGCEPPEQELPVWFRRLGTLCARIHSHSLSWSPPAGFVRPVLEWQALVGPRALWGKWSDAPGLNSSSAAILTRTLERLFERVEHYGMGPDRFGLIHGDLRLQNLLVHGNDVHVIDFDDCGTSWFLYDLATATSLIEDLPSTPELVDNWVSGYVTHRPLSREHIEMIPHFIMLRRLQVLGWFGSRPEAQLTREHAPTYVPATVVAATEFLSGRSRLQSSL